MPVRTAALTIDGETGEPKLLSTQINHDPWLVVLYNEALSIRKGKKEKVYSVARERADRLEEKYPKEEGYIVCVVSRQVGYGPPYSRISDRQLYDLNEQGKWWCPYCRALRKYLWDPYYGLKRCPICHIMERDFHVRKNNPIFWDSETIKRVLYWEEN